MTDQHQPRSKEANQAYSGQEPSVSENKNNQDYDPNDGKNILSKSFLGNVIEICIVTANYKQTLRSLSKLGIGPWRVYTFTPENTTNQTYHGKPSPFRLKVCFADLLGTHNERAGLVYEVIQPLSLDPNDDDDNNNSDGNDKGGTIMIENNIFAEFLLKSSSSSSSSGDKQTHGPGSAKGNTAGIHHIAYDLNNIPFEQREAEFNQRGFQMTQGGSWMGVNHFAFFEPIKTKQKQEDQSAVQQHVDGKFTTSADEGSHLDAAAAAEDTNINDEDNDPGTVFETIAFPENWQYPEPEEWFPSAPSS